AVVLFRLLGAVPPQSQPDVTLPIFPADNPWNWDVSGASVDTVYSNAIIASIGASTHIREDYAFPYSVVQNGQPDVTVAFNKNPSYPDESDPGPSYGSLP